jgi:Protein of unknown function (DUF2752)
LIGLLSRAERWHHYGVIGVCSFPLATSFRIAGGIPIGSISCPIRHWLGVICPSCGLTRSFVALARGDLGQSIDYHAFGPLLFAGLTVTLVHCLWELWRERHLNVFYGRWPTNRLLQASIIASFMGYYLLRLAQVIPTVHL